MMDWRRFNDQFRETEYERNDRLRRARLKKQCAAGHLWSHRNDGKVSLCSRCGEVRDNEPAPPGAEG